MVLRFAGEVVMRPVSRSSCASHGRQRKEMEAQDWGFAVDSLDRPWRLTDEGSRMRLWSVVISGLLECGPAEE